MTVYDPTRPVIVHFYRAITRYGVALLLASSVAGCGSFLSESGPGRDAVVTKAAAVSASPVTPLSYRLVTVNSVSLPALEDPPAESTFDLIPTRAVTRGTIGVGDDIGITIFEAGPGGLFITDHPENASGNSITLPSQQVDETGAITVPYGGSVPVVGRTPTAVAQAIQQRISARALEPQVVVTILNRRAGMINVVGDVGGATRFPLDPGGETLLGAISRAGGPRFPDYETVVKLHRHGHIETTKLSTIVERPEQNISLEAGDMLYLEHKADFFLALGATGQATSLGPIDRRIAFGDARITLVDALAKAGGLQDDRANARACFVYRFERGRDGKQAPLPTIYLTDLRDPAGYFYASQFAMHPEDVVFVSNAPITDLTKFLSLVLPVAYSASGFNSGLR